MYIQFKCVYYENLNLFLFKLISYIKMCTPIHDAHINVILYQTPYKISVCSIFHVRHNVSYY